MHFTLVLTASHSSSITFSYVNLQFSKFRDPQAIVLRRKHVFILNNVDKHEEVKVNPGPSAKSGSSALPPTLGWAFVTLMNECSHKEGVGDCWTLRPYHGLGACPAMAVMPLEWDMHAPAYHLAVLWRSWGEAAVPWSTLDCGSCQQCLPGTREKL